MTTETQTFWTILPNGIVNEKARLSVFVTPKLVGEAGDVLTLVDFPDMLDWPQLVRSVEFKLYWRKDETTSAVPINNGATFGPSNAGEFGLNSRIWNHLFKTRSVPVDPELRSAEAEAFFERSLPVAATYRAAIIDRMVAETQIYHTMRAVLNVGEEPQNPDLLNKREFDRLVFLASGEDEAQLRPSKFPTEVEGGFSYGTASEATNFFGEFPLDGDIEELTARPQSLVQQYRAFELYHRHGIRNRNYGIRQPLMESREYPEFNFHSSNQFQIGTDKNQAVLEFSENMPVFLPSISDDDVPAGFRVSVFYAPDESVASILSSEEVARRVPGKTTNSIGGLNYAPITVRASGSETIGGATGTEVDAFRGVTFLRTSSGQWAARPLEQQDFHSIVSGFGSYPILLRRLGLIYDLEFEASLLPGQNENFQLLVEPVLQTEVEVARPNFSAHVGWSSCTTGEFFSETSSGVTFRSFCMASEVEGDATSFGGFQVLNPRKLNRQATVGFSLQDTDAAIHKVIDKAIADGAPADPNSLDNRLNPYSSERRILAPGSPLAATGDPNAVEIEGEFRQPASRSTGISIFLDQDGSRSVEQYQRSLSRSAMLGTAIGAQSIWPADLSSAPVSFRDDVTAGWKIDVFVAGDDVTEDAQKWYSLSDRQIKLNFLDNSELGQYLAPSDASWTEKAGVSEVDESGGLQLRISDYNFRIDQWSNLSTRHPSKAVPELGDGGETWERSVSLNVTTEAVAYSQAKIRYGRTYTFRASLRDLAGNGIHFDYANASMSSLDTPLAKAVVSEPITYRRLDPISPPVLYALQPPGPGSKVPESRTGNGAQENTSVGPDQSDILIIRSGASVPASLGSGEWFIMPPDTDFQEAEAAGIMDGFSDPDVAYEVLERYDGKLPDAYDSEFLSSVRWPSGQFGTPYLPDGYAAGATFCFLPGAERQSSFGTFANRANSVIGRSRQLNFDLRKTITSGRRPFSRPFRLQLRSGSRANTKTGRDLVVELPPGEQQLVKVSCYPDAERLNHFELAHQSLNFDSDFYVQTQGAELINTLKDNFANAQSTFQSGLVYQVSPSKLVRMIHAVPKPINKPVFSEKLRITNRVTGGNAVVMEDPELNLHRVSTGKIDIFVEWDDFLDLPGVQEFPVVRKERRHCFACDVPLPDCTIAPDETHSTFDVGGRHGFPSNKHLQVNYVARATTRYKEYFGEDITGDPDNLIEDSEPSCDIQVLNTAPPPKPEVVYILPSFFWENSVDVDQSSSSSKRTAGFTIFMKRGWFKSGRDERLAVVLQSDVEGASNPEIDPVPVTVWGSDPTIYDKNPIKRQPVLRDCLSAVEWVKACRVPTEGESDGASSSLPEVTKCGSRGAQCLVAARDGVPLPPPVLEGQVDGNLGAAGEDDFLPKNRNADSYGPDLLLDDELRVDIAAYDVACDFRKDLLYAHVELESPGAYTPFVRFALARYQRNSAKYCALSSITYVDYVQLAPDRAVTIADDSGGLSDTRLVSVMGPGRGDESIGFRTNVLRVYRLTERGVAEQYPLEVSGKWLQMEGDKSVFHWQFELQTPSGTQYLIEEHEFENDGTTRIIFSQRIKL